MPQEFIAKCRLRSAACKLIATPNIRGAKSRFAAIRSLVAIAATAMWLGAAQSVSAQDVAMPGMELSGVDNGAAPVSDFGGGNFFSQDLGTTLRLRYNTESYGSNKHGNFDIGTMQVFSMEGSAAFFDGQVTMNDIQGVGYNLGVGYRWMHFPPLSEDMGRMAGVSLWTDGTSTGEGGFFPQIGLSLESLGDMWDWRANGYLPLGSDSQTGEFVSTGVTSFQGFSISELTQAIVDTSYAVAELEGARRLGSERDAWAFAGPYFVGNDDDDAAGFRAGVRGYAYPDLLVQLAVSDDEIFKTNATFSITWFVGRTRTDFQPACGVPDRFREPVLRNDYVALSQSFVTSGVPLTNPDGTALRIVHVDSTAAPGGDGSFETPYDMLSDVNGAGSLEDDIILAHALSVFTSDVTTTLKNNQRLLGEGDGIEHTVATAEQGTIIIPETAPGARDAARPMIVSAIGDAIVLADNNEVNNFDIDGMGTTVRAIASPAGGSGNPVLRNLDISNTTGDAINLTVLDFIDVDDVDGDGNTTERLVRGNATIDDVVFDNIGEDDIDYTGTAVDVTLPNVQLQEVIAITDVSTTDGNGRGIAIANTHTGAGRTATVNNYTYDGGANGLAGIELTNFDSTFNASNATFTNSNTAGNGVNIFGDSDGTMTFASTAIFNSVDGTTINIDGSQAGTDQLGGIITFNGAITTDNGRSVAIQNMDTGAVVTFSATADITHTTTGAGEEGVFITDNDDGTIAFNGDLILTTDGSIAFDASETDNNVVLTAPSANNSITTTNEIGLRIVGVEVGGAGVNFPSFNASGGVNGAFLQDNTGGPITLGLLGNDAGESGTIAATGDGIVIDNSANVTVSGIEINNMAGNSGVLVNKDTTGTQIVNLNDLLIDDGGFGVETTGNGTGALQMTINDSAINRSTDAGISISNIDTGPIQINNTVLDGDNLNGTQDGIRITGSNAQITIDANQAADDTIIREFGDNEFEVDDGSPNVTMHGSIVNTLGRSVFIHNVDAGSVNFTTNSSIDDDGTGMLIDTNAGGVFSFLGTNDFDTTVNNAVTFSNNTGNTDAVFEDLDINTTDGDGVVITGNTNTTSVLITGVDVTSTGTGDGFRATGAGDLTVSGNNNVILATDGVGLNIQGMNIVTGATFEEVTVTSGDTNGIVLQNVTGAQVTIGEAGALDGDGGELTTEGDAIVVTNVANVDFNSVRVNNTTDAASDGVKIDHTSATNMDVTFNNLDIVAADDLAFEVDHSSANLFNLRLISSTLAEQVEMDATGAGAFRVLLDNADITTTGADIALAITFDGSTADGDVTIQNGSEIESVNGRAFDMIVNNSGASVELELDASEFTSATVEDVSIFNNAGATTNANITNNTFSNSTTLNDVVIESNGGAAAGTRINLNLVGNGLGTSTISLVTTGAGVGVFNFGVVDRDNANTNNPANVTFAPLITDFEDIDGPVEMPNGP